MKKKLISLEVIVSHPLSSLSMAPVTVLLNQHLWNKKKPQWPIVMETLLIIRYQFGTVPSLGPPLCSDARAHSTIPV